MKYILMVAICAASLTLTAQEDWEVIAAYQDGREVTMKDHSRERSWVKVPTDTSGAYVLYLYRIDCDDRKWIILTKTEYSSEGKRTSHNEYQFYWYKMQFALPDSLEEIIIKSHCE